jgi:hypothetical protein
MNYSPQKFFRVTSVPLLRKLFTEYNCPWNKLWDALVLCRKDIIYSEFKELSQAERHEVELTMQEVYAVSSSDDGISQLVRTAKFCGVDLSDEFYGYRSRCDKALWFRLNHKNIWEHATRCVYSDSLSKKYWLRYVNLPQKKPKTGQEALDRFGQALSSYYIEAEGRGHGAKVEHFKRSDELDYYFVHLSDHPKVYEVWEAEHGFQKKSECGLFELVFAMDSARGVLDVHAKGGKKIKSALKEIFLHEILEELFTVSNIGKHAYNIDALKYNSFNFYTAPEDRVLKVFIKKMTLSKQEKGEKFIALQVAPESEDFYNALEHDLNIKELNLQSLNVEKVTLLIKAIRNGKVSSFSLDISKSSCNLKSKCEWQRILGEKYLRLWGIDNVEVAA